MQARIGVHDWEKLAAQPVVLDVELDVLKANACLSDHLDETVDYAAVIEAIRAVAMEPHALVEAMAHSMCVAVLANEDVLRVRLTLMKLAPFPGAEVGVVLELSRAPTDQPTDV